MRLKGYSLAAALVLLFFTWGSEQVHASECPVYTHYVTQGYDYKGLIKFGGIDLDPMRGGIQNTLQTAPGKRVKAQARWIFGSECQDCRIYVNVFGSWDQDREIAELYSGPVGTSSSITLAAFSFNAPDTEGEYIVRVIFSMGGGYAGDFQAAGLKKSCEGERHVFFMDGLLNVSGEAVGVRILSPRVEVGAGVAKKLKGASLVINASIRGNISGVEVFIDGKKVSDELPYTWSTVNESPGIHLVAVEAFRDAIRVRDEVRVELASGSYTGTEKPPALEWVTEFAGELKAAVPSGDGRFILAAVDDALLMYDRAGSLVWRKTQKGIRKIAVSPDGSTLAAASERVLTYMTNSGDDLWNFTPGEGIAAAAVTPSGKTAVASRGTIHLLDAAGGVVWNVSLGEDLIALSAAGDEYVAAASKNRIFLFSNQSALQWSYPLPGEVKALASTASGMIAAATKEEVVLISDGVLIRSFSVEDSTTGIGVSSDGRDVAVAGKNSVRLYRDGAMIWSVASESPVRDVFIMGDASEVLYTEGSRMVMLRGGIKKDVGPGIEGVKIWVIAVAVVAAAAAGIILRSRKLKPPEKPEPAGEEGKEAKIELEPVSESLKILGEGSLMVHVLNSRTKKPVLKATVYLNGRSKETDEDGKAVFEDVTRGRYKIKVERKFYHPVEAGHVFRGPEEQVRLELAPKIGLREEHEARLKTALEEVRGRYETVAHLDTCLPGYLRSVAESIVDFVETSSDILGEYGEETMENLVSTAESVCEGLGEVILDWRNVRLYEVGGKAEGECHARPLREVEKLDKAVSDPGKFIDIHLPSLRRRLELLDREITGLIGRLTITPLAGVWKIAEGLIVDAQGAMGERDEGKKKLKAKASLELVFAGYLLACAEDMLKKEDILERLRHHIL